MLKELFMSGGKEVTGNILDGTPEENLVIKAYKLLKSDYDIPDLINYMATQGIPVEVRHKK